MCLLGCRVSIQKLCALWEIDQVFGGNSDKMSARIKTESARFYLKNPQTIMNCLRFLHLGGALIRFVGFQVAAREDARAGVGSGSNSDGDSGSKKPGEIDKSALAISAPRRVRDKEQLRYVASQPCLVCGRLPSHAHHIRYAQPRAMGRKVSDEWTVPLCATHHRALHTVGDEERWWKESGINPIIHAKKLWRERRGEAIQQPSRARELISPSPS